MRLPKAQVRRVRQMNPAYSPTRLPPPPAALPCDQVEEAPQQRP